MPHRGGGWNGRIVDHANKKVTVRPARYMGFIITRLGNKCLLSEQCPIA